MRLPIKFFDAHLYFLECREDRFVMANIFIIPLERSSFQEDGINFLQKSFVDKAPGQARKLHTMSG